jgi:hypothetical protein
VGVDDLQGLAAFDEDGLAAPGGDGMTFCHDGLPFAFVPGCNGSTIAMP